MLVQVALYVVGILICLLVNGFSVTVEQEAAFNNSIKQIDFRALDDAQYEYFDAENAYSKSRGWFFSCDDVCQIRKRSAEIAKEKFETLKADHAAQMSDAKAKLGVFSTYGVGETRDLFWSSFAKVCPCLSVAVFDVVVASR